MTTGPRGLSPAEPGFTAAPCGVVGASARAAVHSLARAGYSAWAVDQFGDRDLKRVAACAVCPYDRYPDALPELAAQFPPGPVLYTGGLENHPHIVAELARSRDLWGNPPNVLARVRDPFRLSRMLLNAGYPTPHLVAQEEPCPSEGRYLRKPLRSGGGLGVRFSEPNEPASSDQIFQEFVCGPLLSAQFVNDRLVGVTEQLVGESSLHAKPFAYCGNVGPVPFPAAVAWIGNLLCETGLRGVWGADFVLRDGQPFVLEVNPRYTAAMEVLEHATGARPLSVANKRRWDEDGYGLPPIKADNATIGKAIYYAPHAITFPHSGPWDADLAGAFDPWRLPTFADIPEAGSAIQAGWPVLTFFATGSTPAEVRERLQSRAAELDRLFAEHST